MGCATIAIILYKILAVNDSGIYIIYVCIYKSRIPCSDVILVTIFTCAYVSGGHYANVSTYTRLWSSSVEGCIVRKMTSWSSCRCILVDIARRKARESSEKCRTNIVNCVSETSETVRRARVYLGNRHFEWLGDYNVIVRFTVCRIVTIYLQTSITFVCLEMY